MPLLIFAMLPLRRWCLSFRASLIPCRLFAIIDVAAIFHTPWCHMLLLSLFTRCFSRFAIFRAYYNTFKAHTHDAAIMLSGDAYAIGARLLLMLLFYSLLLLRYAAAWYFLLPLLSMPPLIIFAATPFSPFISISFLRFAAADADVCFTCFSLFHDAMRCCFSLIYAMILFSCCCRCYRCRFRLFSFICRRRHYYWCCFIRAAFFFATLFSPKKPGRYCFHERHAMPPLLRARCRYRYCCFFFAIFLLLILLSAMLVIRYCCCLH